MARERARGDVRRAVVGEAREPGRVLGAVVGDEQGQRLVVASAVGPPDDDLELGAQCARLDGQAVGGAGHSLGAQPCRGGVAGQLHHRLLAERARRPQRVGRIGPVLVPTVGALHFERVLEAIERRGRRHPQRPTVALAREGLGDDREAAIGRQPDAGERLVGIGEAQDDRVPFHERAGGGDRRRHGRQASGRGGGRRGPGARMSPCLPRSPYASSAAPPQCSTTPACACSRTRPSTRRASTRAA